MTKKIRIFFAVLLFAGASLPLAQAKRSKNPRRRRRPPAHAVRPPALPEGPAKERLAAGRWDPRVKAALEDLVFEKGKINAGYDPLQPPVAVFAWDDAAIVNDSSEAVFTRLVERVDFKFEDGFWQNVPLAYGRQRLRAYYEQFSGEPQSVWLRQSAYQEYRKSFLRNYEDMCHRLGRKECRSWLSKLCWGFKEDELREYAQAVVRDELGRPLETESVRLSADDRAPATIRRGLRAIPEIRDLFRLLIGAGFDVWVIADGNQWATETMAKEYGVDPSRVAGIRVVLEKGKLGSEVAEPVPFRAGKVDAIASFIGRPPALAVGADPWDAEMLGYGDGLRVLLDKGDAALKAIAGENGWLIQPAFR